MKTNDSIHAQILTNWTSLWIETALKLIPCVNVLILTALIIILEY